MSISDGNPVNAEYTNQKLASKEIDNELTGIQSLKHENSESGADILDVQKSINDLNAILNNIVNGNTVSNIGGEAQLFKQQVGFDLEFRTIKGVNSMTAVVNGDTVEISHPILFLDADPISPTENTLWFNYVELKWKFYDGTSTTETDFVQTGGTGGGGGLDIYHQENFEELDILSFTTGNDVIILNGGTLDGALSYETVNQLSKTRSLKYVAGSSSINDYFISSTIDLDPKQRGNDSGITFYFTWSGTNKVEIVVYDETNGAKLNSTLDSVNGTSNARRYSGSFYPPNNCSQIRYGVHFIEAPTNGDTLIIDDVELSTNPFIYKNIGRENVFSARVANNGTATLTSESSAFISSVTRSSLGVIDVFFETGFFNEVPSVVSCTEVLNGNVTTVDNITVAGFTMETNDINGSKQDRDVSFIIQRQGADYGQTSENVVTAAKSKANFYSSRIENNGTASIKSESISFIDSVSRVTTGRILVSFKAGTFSEAPAIVVTPEVATSADVTSYIYTETTSSSVTIQTTRNSTDFDMDIELMVMSQGADVNDDIFLVATPTQKMAYLRDEKPAGTQGGTASAQTVHTRDLNTGSGDSSIYELLNNQFKLYRGVYKIKARMPAYSVNQHQGFLYNATDLSYVEDVNNPNAVADSSNNGSTPAIVECTLILKNEKWFELRHWTNTGNTSVGLGLTVAAISGNPSTVDVYTTLELTKIR